MSGPSQTDQKLAEDIDKLSAKVDALTEAVTDFRVECAGTFAEIRNELGWIKRIGAFGIGLIVMACIPALIAYNSIIGATRDNAKDIADLTRVVREMKTEMTEGFDRLGAKIDARSVPK